MMYVLGAAGSELRKYFIAAGVSYRCCHHESDDITMEHAIYLANGHVSTTEIVERQHDGLNRNHLVSSFMLDEFSNK